MTTPSEIIGLVACVTGVPAPAITGRRRTNQVVWARFLTVAKLRQTFTWWSLTEIGHEIGRDHGSITHALKQYRRLIMQETAFRSFATELGLIPSP